LLFIAVFWSESSHDPIVRNLPNSYSTFSSETLVLKTL
jgi:hypothetical protein